MRTADFMPINFIFPEKKTANEMTKLEFYARVYARIKILNKIMIDELNIKSFGKSTLREKSRTATRNLRTNSASTMYYKVVITIINK